MHRGRTDSLTKLARPELFQQLVLRDHPGAVFEEVDEHVEDLGSI